MVPLDGPSRRPLSMVTLDSPLNGSETAILDGPSRRPLEAALSTIPLDGPLERRPRDGIRPPTPAPDCAGWRPGTLSRGPCRRVRVTGTLPMGFCLRDLAIGILSQGPCHGALVTCGVFFTGFLSQGSYRRDLATETLVTGVLSQGSLSRGPPCHMVLVIGTLSQGPCRRDLVTGILSQGPCHGALVLGILSQESCHEERDTGISCHGDLVMETSLHPCHRDLVTGSLSQGTCRWDLVMGFLSQKSCQWDLVTGILVSGPRPGQGRKRVLWSGSRFVEDPRLGPHPGSARMGGPETRTPPRVIAGPGPDPLPALVLGTSSRGCCRWPFSQRPATHCRRNLVTRPVKYPEGRAPARRLSLARPLDGRLRGLFDGPLQAPTHISLQGTSALTRGSFKAPRKGPRPSQGPSVRDIPFSVASHGPVVRSARRAVRGLLVCFPRTGPW